jgi:Predicted aminopeptidases
MKWPFSFKKKKSEIPLFEKRSDSPSEVESLKAGKLASLALGRMKELLEKTGPRAAGSEESRTAARELKEAFAPYTDDALITVHRASPGRFYGFFKIASILSPVLVLLCWLGLPYAALILFGVFCYWFFEEFVRYGTVKCFSFFKKKDITNVHAVIEPEGETEKTIIFSAHHDSAPLTRWQSRDKKQYALSLYLPFAVLALTGLLSLILTISEACRLELIRFNLPSVAALVFLLLFSVSQLVFIKLWGFVGDTYSPGAGDNLISSSMLVELAHYFSWKKKNGEGFEHTKLVFVSFDGEEEGLCGSKAWYRQYGSSLVNPVNINIDSPYNRNELCFLTGDANGFQKLNQTLATKLAETAERMGYPAKTGSLPFLSGATDAASAERAGIPSTTLMCISMNGSGNEPYHTADDLPSALSLDTLEAVISILIKYTEGEETIIKNKGEQPLLLSSDKVFRIVR